MTGEKDIITQGPANDEEKRTEGQGGTPSAADVRRLMRSQNIKTGLMALVLALIGGVSIWFAASGRAASQDSYNATAVQLANQDRTACLTERRNAQSDALGRISINANEAENQGLVVGNDKEALRYLGLFHEAVEDWEAATDSLRPENLNAPKSEGGCGPPIISLDDLERAG